MPELSFKQILEAPDLVTELVDVPEWGKDAQVRIKVMSGDEQAAYERSMVKIKGTSQEADIANHYAKLLARCMCDNEGRRLFNDSQIDALGKKSFRALKRLHDAATKLNGLDKSIEELAKNSNSISPSDSASDSPTT
jgi:hypothetical protein